MSKATIFINGVIGDDTTLAGVISQFKQFENPSSVDVFISSPGGYVKQGEAIYNYLKGLGIPVTTITAQAYSIAAQIFMAGSTRLVEDVDKPLMVHMPLIKDLTGNSETLKAVADDLEELEKTFVDFYSALLDLDKATIEALLKNETFLSAEEAVSLGFATGKKEAPKAVALLHREVEKPKNNFMPNLLKAIAQKLGVLDPVSLVLQDATGADIDFYELSEGESPSEGDKARIDGSDADGSIVMPSGETFVFESGELKTIEPAEEEESETETETETEAVAEVIKEVLKWEVDVDQNSFDVGTQITRTYEDETYNIGAGEWELSDGRRVVTDSSGIVVTVKKADEVEGPAETETDPAPVETEANAETETEDENLSEKVIAKLFEKNEALEAELESIKKAIGSADIDDEDKPKPPKPFAEMTPLEKYRATKNNHI